MDNPATTRLTVPPLPLTISEAKFVDNIIDMARWYQCRVAHFRPARTEKGYRTAMQGDVGFPDLVIARDGWVILAECKARLGKATPGQKKWLTALGGYGRLWHPHDWPDIVAELRSGPS